MINKTKIAFIICAGMILFASLFQSLNILDDIEYAVLDYKFNEFEREVPKDHISIAYIDDKSLISFQENHGILWPWPRDVYSIVHNYLVSKGARLVVYDIIFDQPDFDRASIRGSESDSSFALVLKTYSNGILSAQSSEGTRIKTINDGILLHPNIRLEDTLRYSINNLPTPLLLESAVGLGSVAVPSNGQSVIRSVPLFFAIGDQGFIPGLATASYMALNNLNDSDINYSRNKGLSLGDNLVPVAKDLDYLINWYKTVEEENNSFENISFYGLFRAALEFSQLGEAAADPLIDFQDKIIFIGSNAAGLSDIKSTPMSATKPMPGVEIHASILNNLIDQDYIKTLPFTFNLLILYALIIVLVASIIWSSFRVNIPFTAIILISIIISGLYLFAEFRFWIPTFEFVFISFLTSFVTYSVKYANESYHRRKIRSAFDLYVQKELVEEVLKKPEMLRLGGQRKDLTILFSDLAGFTTISEDNEPEDLVKFLNIYLSEMTDIILNNRGTLDKYIGDAIMAFWGAPLPDEEHAYLACKSVLEMELKIKELGDKLSISGMPFPLVRYGVNTGSVVVGNMGSNNRFNYTVMGDNVNLAARLEPANKIFGTQILISESTQTLVKNDFLTRMVALLQVKGKSNPIKIYELITKMDVANDKQHAFINTYQNALNLYFDRQWDSALDAFQKVNDLGINDSVSNLYIEEIKGFKNQAPPKEWIGVLKQITK